jgi:hypothetical protein
MEAVDDRCRGYEVRPVKPALSGHDYWQKRHSPSSPELSRAFCSTTPLVQSAYTVPISMTRSNPCVYWSRSVRCDFGFLCHPQRRRGNGRRCRLTRTGTAWGGRATAGSVVTSSARSRSRTAIRRCRSRASSNLNADMAMSCRAPSCDSSRSRAASRVRLASSSPLMGAIGTKNGGSSAFPAARHDVIA